MAPARLRQVEGVEKWVALLHPDEIQAKLGYRLDREEAVGVLVAWSLHVPLQTDEHARDIGKRVGSIVGPINVKLKALRRRGVNTASQCEALLSAPASLSRSPKKPTIAPSPPAAAATIGFCTTTCGTKAGATATATAGAWRMVPGGEGCMRGSE